MEICARAVFMPETASTVRVLGWGMETYGSRLPSVCDGVVDARKTPQVTIWVTPISFELPQRQCVHDFNNPRRKTPTDKYKLLRYERCSIHVESPHVNYLRFFIPFSNSSKSIRLVPPNKRLVRLGKQI